MDLIWIIVAVIFAVYVVGVTLYIILENRSAQSTFAWLFLFILAPLIGLLVYYFFGKGWRVFAKENELVKEEMGHDLLADLKPLLACQEEYVARIAREEPGAYDKKMLQLSERNSSSLLTAYNQVDILQDASAKYPRLLVDLQQAKHHIHLNYYIWTEDEFTEQVKAVLIERAQAGVEVRCLYDASGGSMSRAYRQALIEAGVKIHAYLEFLSLSRIHTANHRSHRKLAVIDGRIGYMGGLNLDKDQLDGGPHFDSWRDTHLRMVGEAALVLQASFAISWFNTTGEKVVGPAYYPPLAPEIETFMPVQIIPSGPDCQWGAIRQLYFYMIMAAEETVYVQSPFFILDESIKEALKAAALAGVQVKIMCSPRGTTYSIPYWAANTYFQEVAEAGVEIYLYQAGYFHPKTVMVDSAICTIGTANIDPRSFNLNYEQNAVIYDETKTKALEQDFLRDLEHCIQWSLTEYESRPIYLRLRDSLSRLASPVL